MTPYSIVLHVFLSEVLFFFFFFFTQNNQQNEMDINFVNKLNIYHVSTTVKRETLLKLITALLKR